jgi:hypothetical protein
MSDWNWKEIVIMAIAVFGGLPILIMLIGLVLMFILTLRDEKQRRGK